VASIRNLYGLSVEELSEALSPLEPRPFTARQIAAHLYARRLLDFDRMTDLPAKLRAELARSFTIQLPSPAETLVSRDGTTRYVLSLPSAGSVEAVFIPSGKRATLCISSQSGCALGCTFCMTGTLGLLRHLSSGEIAGQVALLMDLHRLRPNCFNIVFMGMGEPLHNYQALKAALRLLCDRRTGFGISPGHITVSTAGLAPAIEKLAAEEIVPRLAVSLNATTDEARSRIMPINKSYPILSLMEACGKFLREAGQRLTLEYVMLSGVNDSREDLPRLARLASSLPARVNLIPFNATPELPFQPSPMEQVRRFRDGLLKRGVRASIRASRGPDIRAACGQLSFGAPGDGAAGTGRGESAAGKNRRASDPPEAAMERAAAGELVAR